jgi:hypothetical protein
MFLVWGPELAWICNDECSAMLGTSKRDQLGRPFATIWPEAWDAVAPLLQRTVDGQPEWSRSPLFLPRHLNGAEERVAFSCAPVPDESGDVGGILCTCTQLDTRVDDPEGRTREQMFREEARALERLTAIGAAVAAELDLHRAVQVVTDAATEMTGAAFGSFFYNVLNEAGESYTLYTLSGVPREAFADFPMPRNTKVFGPTFRGEGIVRSDDITKDPRYGQNPPYRGMPNGHLPLRSYLAAPVISRSGEVLGGLFFGHPATAVFTPRSERLLAGIAHQAAIAIDNARLFQAAQSEIDQRRRIEHHQQSLLAELNHRVKNMLAVVIGIASQSARGAESLENFQEGFFERLSSLARAHTILSERNWLPTPLRQVATEMLAPYRETEA